MGQVGSLDRGYQTPIALSNGLILQKITFSNINKVISISGNDDTDAISSIILPKAPLSEFVQNNKPQDEFPFLLKINNKENLILTFGLSKDLINDFQKMNNLKHFTIFNNLKINISTDGSKLLKDEIITRVVEITSKDTSNPDSPKYEQQISINPKTNQFDVKLNLSELNQFQGKLYIKLMGNNEDIFKTIVHLDGDNTRNVSERKVNDSGSNESENSFDENEGDDVLNTKETLTDPQYEFLADGLQFRNNLMEIEDNLINFKNLIKNLIKKSQALEEAERNLAITRSNLSGSLSDLNKFSSVINNKNFKDIINDLIPIFTENSTQNIDNANLIMKNISTPLLLFYNSDFKLLQNKKKLYHDQAKEFRSWSAMHKSQLDLEGIDHNDDQMLLTKRLTFETARLNYFNYLNEFRNGYLVRNLIHNLAVFLQNYSHLLNDPKEKGSKSSSSSSNSSTRRNNITRKLQNLHINKAFDYYRNFNNYKSEQELFKAKLSSIETMKDLQALLPNPPIASSSTLMNSTSSDIDRPKPISKDSLSSIVSNYANTSSAQDQYQPNGSLKHLNRSRSTVSRSKDDLLQQKHMRSQSMVRKSSYTPQTDHVIVPPTSPLGVVQNIDQSNTICCDCGSTKSVEWISLNLLVVVCIDCSGVHRSMGTHISKIRSLTLDVRAFQSKESIELLYHVANGFANSYWEGMISLKNKITPLCSADERKTFIYNKYQYKKYMVKEPNFKPSDALVKGVHTANVPLILKSLALGANSSMVVLKKVGPIQLELSLFEYALTHFHGTPEDPIFDVATILVLNNTPCGDRISTNLPMGPKQKQFWAEKIEQYHPKPTSFVPQRQSSIDFSGSKLTGSYNNTNGNLTNGNSKSTPRSSSIRKSLSLKNIKKDKEKEREKEKAKEKEKEKEKPRDRTNRASKLKFFK